jgi:hypothetical protein
MASTVSANGLAVATSSSSHYAVTIAEIRLVNRQVPTPLPNFIASEHIARGYPTTVLFDEGKVWNVPVEVGDPPKSNPVDTWPGAKSQAINSFASAAPARAHRTCSWRQESPLLQPHYRAERATVRHHHGQARLMLLKEYEDSLAKQKAKPDVTRPARAEVAVLVRAGSGAAGCRSRRRPKRRRSRAATPGAGR